MLSWFRRYRAAKRLYEEDLAKAKHAPRLHGINLLEWRYLGRTVISYSDPFTKEITSSATVFGFCKMEDTNQRQFVVTPHGRHCHFDYHTWVTEHAALWAIGERSLWEIAGTEPSRWLQEHMLEEYDELWSHETNWWVKKGTLPKKKAKLEVVKDAVSDNVVHHDFKSKKPEKT